MDILVKSFNRPYYLERCLRSLKLQLRGNYTIKVLDDGTPEKYLQRIGTLFPDVQVFRSPFYAQKAAAIDAAARNEALYSLFSIPSRFWIDAVSGSTDLFYLFEDDFWLTRPLSLPDVEAVMRHEQLVMVKTHWGDNPHFLKGPKRTLTPEINAYRPKIPAQVDFLFHNRLRSLSILHRLGLFQINTRFIMPLYDLYSVASAFFDKHYWLYLWNTAQDGKVNENLQLINAIRYWKTRKPSFAYYPVDVSTTSYITSATNNYEGIDLDVFRFNHILNEAWLEGRLDAMEGYPADLPQTTIETILNQAADPAASFPEWLKWVERFKGQYASFGYLIP
ncbi:MAG: glycosyltransferase [Sphingobacteriales bacterium]|nr:MAG: glycosyltransferase [Sphingobacteriales bacterium]